MQEESEYQQADKGPEEALASQTRSINSIYIFSKEFDTPGEIGSIESGDQIQKWVDNSNNVPSLFKPITNQPDQSNRSKSPQYNRQLKQAATTVNSKVNTPNQNDMVHNRHQMLVKVQSSKNHKVGAMAGIASHHETISTKREQETSDDQITLNDSFQPNRVGATIYPNAEQAQQTSGKAMFKLPMARNDRNVQNAQHRLSPPLSTLNSQNENTSTKANAEKGKDLVQRRNQSIKLVLAYYTYINRHCRLQVKTTQQIGQVNNQDQTNFFSSNGFLAKNKVQGVLPAKPHKAMIDHSYNYLKGNTPIMSVFRLNRETAQIESQLSDQYDIMAPTLHYVTPLPSNHGLGNNFSINGKKKMFHKIQLELPINYPLDRSENAGISSANQARQKPIIINSIATGVKTMQRNSSRDVPQTAKESLNGDSKQHDGIHIGSIEVTTKRSNKDGQTKPSSRARQWGKIKVVERTATQIIDYTSFLTGGETVRVSHNGFNSQRNNPAQQSKKQKPMSKTTDSFHEKVYSRQSGQEQKSDHQSMNATGSSWMMMQRAKLNQIKADIQVQDGRENMRKSLKLGDVEEKEHGSSIDESITDYQIIE